MYSSSVPGLRPVPSSLHDIVNADVTMHANGIKYNCLNISIEIYKLSALAQRTHNRKSAHKDRNNCKQTRILLCVQS